MNFISAIQTVGASSLATRRVLSREPHDRLWALSWSNGQARSHTLTAERWSSMSPSTISGGTETAAHLVDLSLRTEAAN